MQLHPKGLLTLVVFAVVLLIGVDPRWGIAAVVAAAAIDWLFLATPFLTDRRRR
jgi:hypothetical protein